MPTTTPLTLEEFRADARRFLDAQAKPLEDQSAAILDIFRSRDEQQERAWVEASRAWQRTLYEEGWAGIAWPEDVGGRGLSQAHALVWAEEERRYEVPNGLFGVTHEMVLPTLLTFGTPAQRAHCRAMLRGDEVWCQLFSEPGAGSDLASLATRAERDGDGWRVTGQKVWTSEAAHASYGYLLARTDPDAPKHAGISAFVVDMQGPGVEVRPLRQMTGGASFSEVFFDAAFVPADGLLGELGGGWKVAMTTLGFERFTSVGRSVAGLLAHARRLPWRDPVHRQRLASAWIQQRILTLLEDQLQARMLAGRPLGPEGSLAKLAVGRLISSLADAAVGVGGMAASVSGAGHDDWTELLLCAPAYHIAGGTDEVLKNLVAERVLGLPKG